MKRGVVAAGALLVVAAAGVVAYIRWNPQPATARVDPAIAVAVAIGALERTESTRLTAEQIGAALPLLRALRDTAPSDADASRALAEEIRRLLTAAQRAELERLREDARRRRQQEGAPGLVRPGPGPAFGPGGAGAGARAEIRTRVLTRVILRLEGRR